MLLGSQKYDARFSSQIQIFSISDPGSRSRGQKSTGSWIPDPQHWLLFTASLRDSAEIYLIVVGERVQVVIVSAK